MGIVWRAHDESLDRPVAVKEFLHYTDPGAAGPADAVDARRRVMRECRIAARLQHANAVNVYNVVEDDDRPWLIMEYQSSRSLADLIAERGTLPPDEVLHIGQQLVSALTAAHAAGIVHRDVKPGNVLVAEDGTAKLTDFGISHAVGDGTITATGEIAGTPTFFAPEVARGEQVTFASDVFSLGSTLYNAVEGEPPFARDDNQIALLYRVATGEITPSSRAGVLTPVLGQLLQSDPAFRPDMNAARAALAAASHTQPAPHTPQPPGPQATTAAPSAAAGDRPRRRVAKVAAGAVALAAASALTIFLVTTSGDDDGDPTASGSAAAGHGKQAAATSESPPTSATTGTTAPASTETSDATPVEAVNSYYDAIPGDLRAGYAKLTKSFKHNRSPSFASYREFWQQYSTVKASDVERQGGNRVSATITYFSADGSTQIEHHLYTLAHTDDGWAIDGQRMA